MKRKLLLALCAAIIAALGIFGLTACSLFSSGGDNENGDNGGASNAAEYSVVFDAADGRFGNNSSEKSYPHYITKDEVDAVVEAFEQPTRDDHVFECWYTDEDCTVKWAGIDGYDGGSSVILYAGYVQTLFALTCNQKTDTAADMWYGGDFTIGSDKYEERRFVTVKLAENARVDVSVSRNRHGTGYTFLGWYDEDGELLTEESSYSLEMPANNVTITAHWANYKITVTDETGGTGTVKKTSANTYNNVYRGDIAGQTATLAATADEGYCFVGWYDENDELLSDKTVYEFEMPYENVAVYTKWTYYTVTTVAEDDDGGNAGSIVNGYSSDKVSPGRNVTLKAAVNDGYSFDGWYEDDTLLSSDLEHTLVMTSENRTFTAKWTYYTATTEAAGDLGDGECSIVDGYDQTKVTAGDEVALKAVCPEPYTFIGWYDDDRLLSENAECTVVMPARSVVYTARFDKFTVTAESDGGGAVEAYNTARTVTFLNSNGAVLGKQVIGCGDRIDIAAANALISRKGFRGWLCDGSRYDFDADITADLTLRAYYFDGSFSSSNDWIDIAAYDEPSFYASIDAGGAYPKTPDRHYFAIPVTGSYILHYRKSAYDPTYPSAKFGSVIKIYNVTQNTWIYENRNNNDIAVPSDKYNQPFNNSTSFTANAGDVVRIDCYESSQGYSTDVDYYLEGERMPRYGGGLASFANDGATAVSAGRTVTLNAVADEGYSFVGWHDGTDIVSTDAAFTFVMGKENVNYTAKWARYTVTVSSAPGGSVALSPASATVTFDLNGQSGVAPEPQTVTRTVGLKEPPRPVAPDGYIFRGWYTDAQCGGEAYDFSSAVDGDMTLYAGWYEMDCNPSSTLRYSVAGDIYNYSADAPFRENALAPSSQQKYTLTYFVIPVSGSYKFYARRRQTANSSGRGVYLTGIASHTDEQSTTLFASLAVLDDNRVSTFTKEFKAGDIVRLSAAATGETTYISSHEYWCWFEYKGEAQYPAKDGGVLSTSAEGTAVQGDDGRAFAVGSSVTVNAVADDGYTFVGWYNSDDRCVSPNAEYTFAMPAANVVYTAKFA